MDLSGGVCKSIGVKMMYLEIFIENMTIKEYEILVDEAMYSYENIDDVDEKSRILDLTGKKLHELGFLEGGSVDYDSLVRLKLTFNNEEQSRRPSNSITEMIDRSLEDGLSKDEIAEQILMMNCSSLYESIMDPYANYEERYTDIIEIVVKIFLDRKIFPPGDSCDFLNAKTLQQFIFNSWYCEDRIRDHRFSIVKKIMKKLGTCMVNCEVEEGAVLYTDYMYEYGDWINRDMFMYCDSTWYCYGYSNILHWLLGINLHRNHETGSYDGDMIFTRSQTVELLSLALLNGVSPYAHDHSGPALMWYLIKLGLVEVIDLMFQTVGREETLYLIRASWDNMMNYYVEENIADNREKVLRVLMTYYLYIGRGDDLDDSYRCWILIKYGLVEAIESGLFLIAGFEKTVHLISRTRGFLLKYAEKNIRYNRGNVLRAVMTYYRYIKEEDNEIKTRFGISKDPLPLDFQIR